MKYLLILFTSFCFGQFNPVQFYEFGSKKDALSTGVSVAYSLRKIIPSYTGNCIRVRRSSDNSESDISFLNGVIDTASLISFVGLNTGYVTIWYDQASNSKNLIQTNTSLQPTIIKMGVLNTLSALPAIECLSQVMDANPVTLGNGTLDIMSGFVVCENKAQGASIGATGHTGYTHFRRRTTTTEFRHNGTVASFAGISTLQQNLLTLIRYDSSNIKYYLNNSLVGTQAMDDIWGTRTFSIGGFTNGSLDIVYQEIIYYYIDVSSKLTSINSNINSYYTIY